MTDRAYAAESRFRFECATHRVSLAALDGPPFMVPAEPIGAGSGWLIDLSDLDCPRGAELAGNDIDEGCQFRIWIAEP